MKTNNNPNGKNWNLVKYITAIPVINMIKMRIKLRNHKEVNKNKDDVDIILPCMIVNNDIADRIKNTNEKIKMTQNKRSVSYNNIFNI